MIRAIVFDALGVLYLEGRLNPNLAAFIREKGDQFTFVLCSASGREVQEALAKDGLAEAFDLVLTAENAPYRKDDPRLYAHIAETLKLNPEELLFLDDVSAFVRAARKAGLRAIHYTDPESFQLAHVHDNPT